MDDTQSVATLIDSTTTKIQQLQQAFAELESHRAVSLNLKWKELEEHFHGLERSLKNRFDELENQQKEYESKASEAREMLEKRKAVVVAKEEASLERLQEKRDAALSAIGDALEKYKKESSETLINDMSNDNSDASVEEKSDIKAADVYSEEVMKPEEVMKLTKNESMDVKPRPQLIKLCEEMDAKGLHQFISDNRKNLGAIREEIPFALNSATDPAQLVLDSLEDFYRVEIPSLDGKRDSNLLGLRRTCLMLMESLGQLITSINPNSDSDNQVISSDIKEQAKVIADRWKPTLDVLDVDASSGNSLEAHAFLQLVASFGIASEFDQDEICKLIPTVSRRRQIADLCRSLGLSEKLPGVIEVLVNGGRQIEAVNLAFAFQLTEQFDPVPLLKAYIKEARKASQVKQGNTSPSAQNEANERELFSLKAVIKCIEEHKLEEQYPLDPLQKRLLQLEKAKADKKRAAEAAKSQSKRPRANGGNYAPRITNIHENSFYRGPERYPYMYDRPYAYPTDNYGSSHLGTATYNISPGHGSYYGNGYQYPTPYLH
ncbi:FRIGIDA-like protein [Tasmannia lanceolata]|uniref:FRIGIDA-like protein n=1 Tax=Tasmannia lanceolata TaxID=3420 RepID=UPI0040630BAF